MVSHVYGGIRRSVPFAAFLVPFVMSLIGAAFLVTVYRELGGQLKPAE